MQNNKHSERRRQNLKDFIRLKFGTISEAERVLGFPKNHFQVALNRGDPLRWEIGKFADLAEKCGTDLDCLLKIVDK